ncbi:MAG TPA: Hsp20/alpha crystallin family protein [Anaerovoracaceae bacterium]|nr:Hsp20/alpha crystallin family protein [Anaerovoracaceae bacterium]
MLLPSIFGERLFDDFMDFPFGGQTKQPSLMRTDVMKSNMMKTDVKDAGDHFELMMDMPGFKKEDVKAKLDDGVLTIDASTSTSNDEKDSDGKYIRRERFMGSCSRSFYVGENLTQEDIKAKFEDGLLKITVPKVEAKPQIEENKYIAIEG